MTILICKTEVKKMNPEYRKYHVDKQYTCILNYATDYLILITEQNIIK